MPHLWQMQVNKVDPMHQHLLHKNQYTFFLFVHASPKTDLFFSSSDSLSTGSTVLSVGKYSINAQQGFSSFVSAFLIKTDATRLPPALCPARIIFSLSIPSSAACQIHNLQFHKLLPLQKEMVLPVQGCNQHPRPYNSAAP